MTFCCRGCGNPVPPSKSTSRRREWCTELCRKNTLYGGTCEGCGSPTGGGDGIAGQHRFCNDCGRLISGEESRVRAKPRREAIERMWTEGLTLREIFAALGQPFSPSACSRWRKRGYDLPYRRPAMADNARRHLLRRDV